MIVYDCTMEKGICSYCGDWALLYDIIDTEDEDLDGIRTSCDQCVREIQ